MQGHIGRLAAVEVQTIMGFLDRESLLRLARCSRRLHADADSDVTWKHQPAHEVQIDGPLLARPICFGALIRRSLLARLPAFAVLLDGDFRQGLGSEALAALLDIPRVTHLQASRNSFLSAEQLMRLIQSPAMDGLRQLELDCVDPPLGFLEELVRMPLLHTLRLNSNFAVADSLSALPRLAQLRTLHMWGDDEPSRLAAVIHCTNLTDLTLVFPRLHGPHFREFFTSPNLRSLQRLRLDHFFAFRHVEPWLLEDLVVAFQALTSLRWLHLHHVDDVDALLAAVSEAPALEELTIGSDHNQPSPDPLVALLRRAPALHIRLLSRQDAFAIKPRAEYAELAAAHPRLRLDEDQDDLPRLLVT